MKIIDTSYYTCLHFSLNFMRILQHKMRAILADSYIVRTDVEIYYRNTDLFSSRTISGDQIQLSLFLTSVVNFECSFKLTSQ